MFTGFREETTLWNWKSLGTYSLLFHIRFIKVDPPSLSRHQLVFVLKSCRHECWLSAWGRWNNGDPLLTNNNNHVHIPFRTLHFVSNVLLALSVMRTRMLSGSARSLDGARVLQFMSPLNALFCVLQRRRRGWSRAKERATGGKSSLSPGDCGLAITVNYLLYLRDGGGIRWHDKLCE